MSNSKTVCSFNTRISKTTINYANRRDLNLDLNLNAAVFIGGQYFEKTLAIRCAFTDRAYLIYQVLENNSLVCLVNTLTKQVQHQINFVDLVLVDCEQDLRNVIQVVAASREPLTDKELDRTFDLNVDHLEGLKMNIEYSNSDHGLFMVKHYPYVAITTTTDPLHLTALFTTDVCDDFAEDRTMIISRNTYIEYGFKEALQRAINTRLALRLIQNIKHTIKRDNHIKTFIEGSEISSYIITVSTDNNNLFELVSYVGAKICYSKTNQTLKQVVDNTGLIVGVFGMLRNHMADNKDMLAELAESNRVLKANRTAEAVYRLAMGLNLMNLAQLDSVIISLACLSTIETKQGGDTERTTRVLNFINESVKGSVKQARKGL